MPINEREKVILSILKEKHFASVQYLSQVLYTSPSSVRRCLTQMQKNGLVYRNHGGVFLRDDERFAAAPDVRIEDHKAEKKEIAQKAASLLRDNITVFLDGSTTSSYLTEYMANFENIRVFTNNICTASALIEYSVETYCIGGYANKHSPVTVGLFAEEMIRGIYADIFFFSSFALSDNGIISDCSPEETSIRKLMFSHSASRVFLCDNSKFHRFSTYGLCSLTEVDHFFFDRDYPELKVGR